MNDPMSPRVMTGTKGVAYDHDGSKDMRIFPGEIRQLGYVVRDLEAAMTYWRESLRVGPFFHFDVAPVGDLRYRGEPCSAQCAVGIANCGQMQIELIQPIDNHPSPYKEMLDAGREGLQHVAFWTEDFDKDFAAATAAGFEPVLTGWTVNDEGKIAYFDDAPAPHPGIMIELSAQTPEKKKVFDRVREVSLSWNGTDPIERLGR